MSRKTKDFGEYSQQMREFIRSSAGEKRLMYLDALKQVSSPTADRWKAQEENETLRAQLAKSQAREAGLRDALEKLREIWWSDKADNGKEMADYERMIEIIELALSTSSPAADRIKDIQDYGTPETWRKGGSDKAKWVRYYKESGRSCNNCAFDTGGMLCSCWGDKFVPRDGLVSLEKEGIPQLCEDQRGNKCTVRESLCGITGDNTCCLTCGKAKNCEDPCEYALEKAGGEK